MFPSPCPLRWHRLIRSAPEAARGGGNWLVPDRHARFTCAALYGLEFELWLRDVLTFALADIWYSSYERSHLWSLFELFYMWSVCFLELFTHVVHG